MGKLSLSLFALGVAACGSNDNGTADAGKTFMDAPPKVFMDAPPKVFLDTPPVNYDFTCFGVTPPTTAPANLTFAGTTETINIQTMMQEGVPTSTVDSFTAGNTTSLDSVVSDANGAFTTGQLATGGTPLDGYIRATKDGYRTTYIYPPNPLAANATDVPVLMLTEATFGLLLQFVLMTTQDDTNNGFLLVQVTDCATPPVGIAGATLTVKQGGNAAGTITDFSQYNAGTFAVTNVPDGDTTVEASFNNMTFPAHVVGAHKKPSGSNATGTITATIVRPGP
jgi:hypothetical protein